MRLLFDENLSPALPGRLLDVYPGSVHVEAIGLRGRSDTDLAAFARREGFVVCTKDADFRHAAWVIADVGPSVIWLRLGNASTAHVAAILRRHVGRVEALAGDGFFTLELAI